MPIFDLPTAKGGWQPQFFKKMFDFDIHANLLEFSAIRPSVNHLPVYEAKMINYFNHRSSTYEGVSARDIDNGQARELSSLN